MKIGDLVRINPGAAAGVGVGKIGVIVFFKSFDRGKNPQPIVMIDGKLMLFGESVCEVINEDR